MAAVGLSPRIIPGLESSSILDPPLDPAPVPPLARLQLLDPDPQRRHFVVHLVDDGVLEVNDASDVVGIDSGDSVVASVVGLEEVEVEVGDP